MSRPGLRSFTYHQAKITKCEAQLQELDNAIKGFNTNEAPIKAKRDGQRKKLAHIQKIITEMSVSLECSIVGVKLISLGRYQEMRASDSVGCK